MGTIIALLDEERVVIGAALHSYAYMSVEPTHARDPRSLGSHQRSAGQHKSQRERQEGTTESQLSSRPDDSVSSCSGSLESPLADSGRLYSRPVQANDSFRARNRAVRAALGSPPVLVGERDRTVPGPDVDADLPNVLGTPRTESGAVDGTPVVGRGTRPGGGRVIRVVHGIEDGVVAAGREEVIAQAGDHRACVDSSRACRRLGGPPGPDRRRGGGDGLERG